APRAISGTMFVSLVRKRIAGPMASAKSFCEGQYARRKGEFDKGLRSREDGLERHLSCTRPLNKWTRLIGEHAAAPPPSPRLRRTGEDGRTPGCWRDFLRYLAL